MKQISIAFIAILIVCPILLGQKTTSTYYYAHSLIWHKKEIANQANIPFWLAELEKAAGDSCLTSGKHVAIHWDPQSVKIPPAHSWAFSFSNHGSAMSPGGSYVAGKHDNVLLTYMNWEIIYDWGASIGQRNPSTNQKATDSIAVIFNWLNANDPGISLFLYECWPKIEKNYIMNGQDWSPSTGTPPNSAQWNKYLNYALENSNEFWQDLQDSLINKAGLVNTKLIPSSMICAKLWQQGGILSDIPVSSIFEDIGPHGKPSTYFLAAMIVYAAQHKKAPTKPFSSHPQIDQRILDRFSSIGSFIMSELTAFNFHNGKSRVWNNVPSRIDEQLLFGETDIMIYPNPVQNVVTVKADFKLVGESYSVYDNMGRVVLTGQITSQNTAIEMNSLSNGMYMFTIGNKIQHIISIIKE